MNVAQLGKDTTMDHEAKVSCIIQRIAQSLYAQANAKDSPCPAIEFDPEIDRIKIAGAFDAREVAENILNDLEVDRTAAPTQPTITCRFDRGVPGCAVDTTLFDNRSAPPSSTAATFYRLRLETKDAPMIPCVGGRLLSIWRDGVEFLQGDALHLTMAPFERNNPIEKHLYADVPEFLDVLALTDAGTIFVPTPHWPASLDPAKIFAELCSSLTSPLGRLNLALYEIRALGI